MNAKSGKADVLAAHPILILNNVISYGGQCGPLAVVGGAHGAAFMSLELADCRRKISKFNIETGR